MAAHFTLVSILNYKNNYFEPCTDQKSDNQGISRAQQSESSVKRVKYDVDQEGSVEDQENQHGLKRKKKKMSLDEQKILAQLRAHYANRDPSHADLIYLGAKFSSFAEFEEVFEKWNEYHLHPFRVASSELLKNVDGEIDETFLYKYVLYKCACHGKPRIRGRGLRPNQSYLACGCEAKIRIIYGQAWNCYKVTRMRIDHIGHEPSVEMFRKLRGGSRKSINASRREDAAPEKEEVEDMEKEDQLQPEDTPSPSVSDDVQNVPQMAQVIPQNWQGQPTVHEQNMVGNLQSEGSAFRRVLAPIQQQQPVQPIQSIQCQLIQQKPIHQQSIHQHQPIQLIQRPQPIQQNHQLIQQQPVQPIQQIQSIQRPPIHRQSIQQHQPIQQQPVQPIQPVQSIQCQQMQLHQPVQTIRQQPIQLDQPIQPVQPIQSIQCQLIPRNPIQQHQPIQPTQAIQCQLIPRKPIQPVQPIQQQPIQQQPIQQQPIQHQQQPVQPSQSIQCQLIPRKPIQQHQPIQPIQLIHQHQSIHRMDPRQAIQRLPNLFHFMPNQQN